MLQIFSLKWSKINLSFHFNSSASNQKLNVKFQWTLLVVVAIIKEEGPNCCFSFQSETNTINFSWLLVWYFSSFLIASWWNKRNIWLRTHILVWHSNKVSASLSNLAWLIILLLTHTRTLIQRLRNWWIENPSLFNCVKIIQNSNYAVVLDCIFT